MQMFLVRASIKLWITFDANVLRSLMTRTQCIVFAEQMRISSCSGWPPTRLTSISSVKNFCPISQNLASFAANMDTRWNIVKGWRGQRPVPIKRIHSKRKRISSSSVFLFCASIWNASLSCQTCLFRSIWSEPSMIGWENKSYFYQIKTKNFIFEGYDVLLRRK